MSKNFKTILGLIFTIIIIAIVIIYGKSGENVSYGALSLIPPIVTIVLAFATKQTLISMFVGTWVGASIINGGNLLNGFMATFTDNIIPQISDEWNAGMLVLIACIGGFMYMINACGGAEAFGRWAQNHSKSRKTGQIIAWFAPFMFLYDQGCLIVGVIMRPVTDRMGISRVKLAYITDTMSAPLVSMSPINDYGVYLIGLIAVEISALGLDESAYSLYFRMFPMNLYAVSAIVTVLLVILLDLNIGPMYTAEKRAIDTGMPYGETDKLIAIPPENNFEAEENISIAAFVIPIISLIVTVISSIFYTGSVMDNGILGSFTNANMQLSIILSFIVGSVVAAIVGWKNNYISFENSIEQWTKGSTSMFQVILILVMAWSISTVTKSMDIGGYLTEVMSGNVPIALIPVLMFAVGVLISFATGSSWGVWAIGMPIAIPLAVSMGISIPLMIGAVISGGLFGDNCSPISDTSIQASTSACCDHMQHIKTQLPYATIVGVCSGVGYFIAGAFSEILALPLTIALIVIVLIAMKKYSVKSYEKHKSSLV